MRALPARRSPLCGRRTIRHGGQRNFACYRFPTASSQRKTIYGKRVRNRVDADVLVIGAGPAGASTAILLKLAGWRVILVEKSSYPRQKVCGECLSAASLALLDQLGVGAAVQDRAGPELHQVGWMSGDSA